MKFFSLLLYTKKAKKTLSFLQDCGFEVEIESGESFSAKTEHFRLHYLDSKTAKAKPESFQKDAFAENKGRGIYIYVEVDDVDETYANLIKKGVKISGEPKDWPWGNREFAVRDPNGYKFVFFNKL